jgi:hypothetical protein
MAQLKLTADILAAAIFGFEVQKAQIEAKIAEIKGLLGNKSVSAPDEIPKPRKKRSAAVRRRMRLAQRLRWSKMKQPSQPTNAEPTKPKRKVSRAARKKMAAAQKKRWAAIKKASGV